MGKVERLSKYSDSAMVISPVDALKELVEDIESGKETINKLVVLYLDKDKVFCYRNSQVTFGDSCLILNVALQELLNRVVL